MKNDEHNILACFSFVLFVTDSEVDVCMVIVYNMGQGVSNL